jgi:predicted CopG family antitoxin
MATHQIRIGEDCIEILNRWRYKKESHSDAIRRIDRRLKKNKESLKTPEY